MNQDLQKIDLKKNFYSTEGFEIHDKIVGPRATGEFIRFIDIVKELQNLKNEINELRQENHKLRLNNEEKYDNKITTNLDSNLKMKAKVVNVYKIAGIGTVVVVDSISEGNMKVGYKYKILKTGKQFEINSLEDNFCPSEYKHPCSKVGFSVKNILVSDFQHGDIIFPI